MKTYDEYKILREKLVSNVVQYKDNNQISLYLEALAELRGFDAAYKIMKKREEGLVEALNKVKPALKIAFEDTSDFYYHNVVSELNEALAKIKEQG